MGSWTINKLSRHGVNAALGSVNAEATGEVMVSAVGPASCDSSGDTFDMSPWLIDVYGAELAGKTAGDRAGKYTFEFAPSADNTASALKLYAFSDAATIAAASTGIDLSGQKIRARVFGA